MITVEITTGSVLGAPQHYVPDSAAGLVLGYDDAGPAVPTRRTLLPTPDDPACPRRSGYGLTVPDEYAERVSDPDVNDLRQFVVPACTACNGDGLLTVAHQDLVRQAMSTRSGEWQTTRAEVREWLAGHRSIR